MGERYGYDTRKFALRMHRPARIMHHDEGDELSVLGGEQNLSDLPVTVSVIALLAPLRRCAWNANYHSFLYAGNVFGSRASNKAAPAEASSHF